MNSTIEKEQSTGGLHLIKRPVRRAEPVEGLREGSTGRVVVMLPPFSSAYGTLPKVWAVAEPNESAAAKSAEPETKPAVELAFYRKYTEALLRRYLRLSMQSGRVPSLLSKDLFRGQVTRYSVRGFEEVVIFCHDVEQRLAKLSPTEQQIIKRVVLQRYSLGETACVLGVHLNTLRTMHGKALDRVTALLLEAGLLDLKTL